MKIQVDYDIFLAYNCYRHSKQTGSHIEIKTLYLND